MDKNISIEPFPPGGYVQEFMEGKGWTQDDLAEVLGRSRQHVNRLLQSKTSISPETAFELANAFGTSAKLWMNLQGSFELSCAAAEKQDVARRSDVYSKYPVRELARRGWINMSKDIVVLEQEICNFLSIQTIEEEPSLAVAARKSTTYEYDTSSQKAWYCRCRELAKNAPAAPYKEGKLEDAIKSILELAAYPEDTRRVPKVLADYGIRFVINKHLKGTGMDAVAFWLTPKQPAIAVSLRHGRIDNFWFNLMHELVHIKYRDKEHVDNDLDKYQDSGDLSDDIEARANREGAEYLVPRDRIRSFINRNKPYFYQRRVVQFAQLHGVHPGIVVGQLQHQPDGLEQNQLRKLLVGIREHVIGQAVTDGWGNDTKL